jgi:Tfp pilus assembly protein PilV
MNHSPVQHRRGLSLVEAMMSTLLVAVVLVSSLNLVGAVTRSRQVLSDRALASDIAEGLVAEIISRDYGDPSASLSFGLESGETISNKSAFDDVDDFHGWTQSYSFIGRPAESSLRATVSIKRAMLTDPNTRATSDTGLKHIQVAVTKQSRVLAVRDAWKASAP